MNHFDNICDRSLKLFSSISVGFGGAVALFLGFSFLTGVELIYFVIEYLLELIINLIKSHMMRADRISVPEMKRMSTRAQYRATHITTFKAPI